MFHYLKNGDHTSNQVSSIWFGNKDKYLDNLKYKYDEKGNITEIYENSMLIARYKYDSLSRIIREDNKPLNKTVTWEYDAGGNILNRFEYEFTNAQDLSNLSPTIIPYSYATTGIRDRLMSYGNQTNEDSTIPQFKYDAIGNPEYYKYNQLTWERGRLLKKFGNIAEYKYNLDGIRTSKTVGTTTTQYFLDGTKIVSQQDTINTGSMNIDNIMYFEYGSEGVAGFYLNGINYYYKKNLQGDIIGIYDNNLQIIAKYDYDAWGNHKISYLENDVFVDFDPTNSYNEISNNNLYIALKNPFRYRSYYYDQETGLYYLNSRYYDPEIGRFINIDEITVLDVTKIALNGINLYAYCLNNPVNEIDEDGYFIGFLIGLLVGAIIGAIIGAASYTISYLYKGFTTGDWGWNWAEFLGSTLGGMIGGAFSIIPGAGSYISAFVSGFVSNILTDTFSSAMYGTDFNIETSLWEAFKSGILSGAFVGIVNAKYAIKSITFGRGSWSAVSKQIYTKFRRDIIKRISGRTFGKMLGLSFYESSMDIFYNAFKV